MWRYPPTPAYAFIAYSDTYVDRDSSVGTATCYGLNGPGIETR